VSRGPGRWQLILLDAIQDERHSAILVDRIVEAALGRPGTHSERCAARRGVKSLALAGKLRCIYVRAERADAEQAAQQLAVAHPDSAAVSDYHAMDVPVDWAVGQCGKTARQIWHDNGVPGY